jgi:hypothetical protein
MQAEALVVLTWNQGSVILSDSVKNRQVYYDLPVPLFIHYFLVAAANFISVFSKSKVAK